MGQLNRKDIAILSFALVIGLLVLSPCPAKASCEGVCRYDGECWNCEYDPTSNFWCQQMGCFNCVEQQCFARQSEASVRVTVLNKRVNTAPPEDSCEASTELVAVSARVIRIDRIEPRS